MNKALNKLRGCYGWLCKDEHKKAAQKMRSEVGHAFTGHPEETGESYLQHLWFTVSMAGRFLFVTTVLVLHGLFPFALQRAASLQIEKIYGIMKSRIPKKRREELDAIARGPDYCV